MMHRRIWCAVRKEWVTATPEEVVRQLLLSQMIEELDYPRELLVVEKELRELPHLEGEKNAVPHRRADILCYTQSSSGLIPLLLIECKKKGLQSKARAQVIGYNYFVRAPFVAVVSKEGIEVGQYDAQRKAYRFYSGIPRYFDLKNYIL